MISKKIISLIQAEAPWLHSMGDGIFYTLPFDDILTGFIFDKISAGVNVRRLCIPLYEGFNHLNISYSERLKLPEGYMSFSEISDSAALSQEFIRRVTAHREWAESFQSVPVFEKYLLSLGKGLENLIVRRALALTFVMNEKYELAAVEFEKIITDNAWKAYRLAADCDQLLCELNESPTCLLKRLQNWKLQKINALALGS